MVDTIQMFTTDFTVDDWSRWSQHSITDRQTGETTSKEVSNSQHLNATIHTNSNRLVIHTSLPKLLFGTSLYELRQTDGGRAVETLQKTLRDECGISTTDGLKEFGVSRIDFCRNIKVDHKITDYIDALSQLSYSRRDKIAYKGETLSFRNGRRELCFYDKVREVRSDKKLSGELVEYVNSLPNDILRVETRLRRANVVRSDYKDMSIHSMLDERLSSDRLLSEFNGLTKSDADQLSFNFNSNVELIEYIKTKRSRNVFGRFLEVRGTSQLLAECGYNWSVVRELLEAVLKDRSSVYRWMQKIKRHQAVAMVERDRNLIGEIHNKLRLRLVA
jgi:hypothetical protein